MEKPEFVIGNEKRFFDFIKNLNDKNKIALLSHTDLDGIGSAKVVNEVIEADLLKFIKYEELNENLVEELKEKKMNTLILTDVCIYRHFINLLNDFKVLIIDHHPPPEDFNSENITHLVTRNNCATYLCYYLFSKTQDIKKLDWVVACSCIADWAYFKNQEFMSETFHKYGDEFKIEDKIIRKTGKFWELQWKISLALIYFEKNLRKVFDSIGAEFGDIGNLQEYIDEINKEIENCVKRFEEEKEEINGRLFWEFKPKFKIGSIVSTLTSTKHEDKTVIIARPNEKYYNFSARRQDKKEDTGKLLKTLIKDLPESDGGGHIPAAGGRILLEDKEKFKERLKTL